MSSLLQIIPMNEENDMLDDTLRYFLTDEKYKKYRTETLNDGIMCSVETTRPFQSLFRVTYKTNNVVRDITFVGNTKEGIIKTLIAMDIPNTSKFNIEEIDYIEIIAITEGCGENTNDRHFSRMYFALTNGDILTTDQLVELAKEKNPDVLKRDDGVLRAFALSLDDVCNEITHPSITYLINHGFDESAARVYQDKHLGISFEDALKIVRDTDIWIQSKRILHRYYGDKRFDIYRKSGSDYKVISKHEVSESSLRRELREGIRFVARRISITN